LGNSFAIPAFTVSFVEIIHLFGKAGYIIVGTPFIVCAKPDIVARLHPNLPPPPSGYHVAGLKKEPTPTVELKDESVYDTGEIFDKNSKRRTIDS